MGESAEQDREFLLNLSAALQVEREPRSLALAAARHIAEHLCVARAYLVEVDEEARIARVPSEYHRADLQKLPPQRTFDEMSPAILDAARKGLVVVDDTATDPRTADFYTQGYAPMRVGALLLVGLRRESRWVASFVVADSESRAWTEREIALVRSTVERVWPAYEAARARREAERASAEAEEARRRYHDLVQGLDAIVWEADARTFQFTFVSEYAERVLGYPVDRWKEVDFWATIIHGQDRDWAVNYCTTHTRAGHDHEFEYRAIAADGHIVWLHDVVHVVLNDRGESERLRGVMVDITAHKRVEAERAELMEQVDAERQKLNLVLESITDAFFAVDGQWCFTYVNRKAEQLWGRQRGELLGRSYWEVFPQAAGSTASEQLLRAMTERRTVEFDTLSPILGSWVQVHAYPSHDGLSVYIQDITERKRQDKHQRFLADAGHLLASSLDYRTTLSNLAGLVAGRMADWCVVYILGSDDRIHRVAGAHADPERQELLNAYRQYAIALDSDTPVGHVVRTGETLLLPEVLDVHMERVGQDDPEHLHVLRTLGARSFLAVPLRARGQVIGAIAFVRATEGPRYDPRDLEVAEELAHRASLAVDNAQLYEDAQAANRAKSDFLASISHELRTPLNAILGYSELLLLGIPSPIPETAVEHVRRVRTSSRHLLQLIEEVLTFSRLEAGRLAINLESVDAAELARETCELLEPLASQKNLRFFCHTPEEPVPAETDAAKVRQILLNLLSNAIKFTDEGEVGLEVRASRDEVVFEVSDTGIGISPEERQRIFEPFQQGSTGPTRRAGGTGLGLSVTQQLTRLLGGEVVLESTPGEGSRFEVRLPASGERG